MSRPVPSPSMKGMIGFEGTESLPLVMVIGSAVVVMADSFFRGLAWGEIGCCLEFHHRHLGQKCCRMRG